MNYINSLFISNKFYHETKCSVCLEEYRQTEGNRCLKLVCGHLFHEHCVEPWLESQRKCPCCRAECYKYQPVYKELIEASNRPSKSLSGRQRVLVLSGFIYLLAMYTIFNPDLHKAFPDSWWIPYVKPYTESCDKVTNYLMGAGFVGYAIAIIYYIARHYQKTAQLIDYKPHQD